MKFYCLTPCLNPKKFIGETMLSVLNQTVFKDDNFTLYYTILDDQTDSAIDTIKQVITDFPSQNNIKINYLSEPKSSIYAAIARGFESKQSSSDIYCYINVGDYYSPYAFEIAADIFSNNKQVHFLTGTSVYYNEKGHLVGFNDPIYNKYLLLTGLHNRIMLPYIQQESVFWDASMHRLIDYDKLKTFNSAGDYFLRQIFTKHTPLYIVNAYLAGFRFCPNQLNPNCYDMRIAEIKKLMTKLTIFTYLLAYIYKRIIPLLPHKIKKMFMTNTFIYDKKQQKYLLI